MRSNHATRVLTCLSILALSCSAYARGLYVAGPIEKVTSSPRTITVLGQTIAIDESTAILVDGKSLDSARAAALLAVGNFTFVASSDDSSPGGAKAVSTFRGGEYVPGASTVAIAGKVTKLNRASGVLSIGALKVDISAVEPRVLERVNVGNILQISGIQPISAGLLVGPIQLSIGGSGVQQISIGGSGVQSIGGSGAQVLSIGGSGVQKLSIGGSGVQKLSIGGSGSQKTSIGGSGVQKMSIGGSGIQIISIGGSGVDSISIRGSGVDSMSIGGSGTESLSIGGSGAPKNGIGESGVKSIGGSGIQ